MSSGNLSRSIRRNRITRDWISQTELRVKDFILPYFVAEGEDIKRPIESMPGVYHLSIDNVIKDIAESEGLRAVLLFGVIDKKDELGSESYRAGGIVQKAARAVKEKFSELVVITDVCLCGYTSHGHCGIIKAERKNENSFIDVRATLKVLARIALSHAEAGADLVAPSAMTDGQVGTIREALDKHGFTDTGILAYSAKYASNFYGPFRDALNSAPRFGDRKAYQMDFRNPDEALREIEEDISEGADIVMIKPALAYLDILCRAKQKFNVPVAAYNVSGEYSMIKAMSGGDQEMEKNLALEVLTSIKRAGADFIISYFGKEAAKWLK
ncbi:MAG: porphobilinogen synthase [Candidatus Omnitrophica bacterium]|nr:porphobilinogen synthase [Candidatus Omnitrophota bacterium]MBU1128070.1 porphobilinogen synthase [Candidatus Omnitrophota bacterium]MBU1785106.1 porphobilinogen synthase [Candidatus Omnitrophota bacterium]MBU1851069.1 porphobilinogen synthase [Candidatus Omnitrophota bacterium]